MDQPLHSDIKFLISQTAKYKYIYLTSHEKDEIKMTKKKDSALPLPIL